MLLNCSMHTSLIEKRSSHSYQSNHHICFNGFFVAQDYYNVLLLQLVWYYSTSLVSNIADLILVLIFWFRIIKCESFFVVGIIAGNFLKIGNGWAIVVQYATTAVYVGTHFFPQFLENSRSHSNYIQLNFLEKTRSS